MDAREQRGLVIAATCKIVRERKLFKSRYYVPSSSQDGRKYKVDVTTDAPTCTCPDFEERQQACKHIYAVQFVRQRERNPDGSTTVTGRPRAHRCPHRSPRFSIRPAPSVSPTTVAA